MKLCGIFLVLALARSASAASIGQKPDNHPAIFTSELDDGFVATLPKSALASAEDEKDNSLDSRITEQKVQNFVKHSPAQEETHIPVTIVQEPEKVVIKKVETVKPAEGKNPKPVDIKIEDVNKDNVKEEIKQEIKNGEKEEEKKGEKKQDQEVDKKEEKKEEKKQDKEVEKNDEKKEELKNEKKEKVEEKKDEKKEEELKVDENDKKKNENKDENNIPISNSDVKPINSVPNEEDIEEEAECEEEQKLKKQNLNDKLNEKKDTAEPVSDVKIEVSEELRQSDVSVSSTSPPNIFQQGLLGIQQGFQNIGSSIVAIVTPNNNSSDSPPNILTNLQQTLQNIIRPPGDNSANPAPPGILEGIQNFTQGVQQGISSMSVSFQNFISNTFGGQNNNNNRNITILEQGMQTLQQGVQTSLQNLNQTILSITNPSPDRPNIIQSGIQNLQEGVKNLTSGIQSIFRPPANADGTQRPGLLQQTVQNLSQGLQTGVENLNNTLQNIINRPSSDASKPSSVQQPSDQSTAAAVASTRETLEQAFLNELKAINETLQEGVKTLTLNIRDMTSEPLEHKEQAPVGEVVVVAA